MTCDKSYETLKVHTINLETMKTRIEGHSDTVLCCHVMADRKLLLSGGEDGNICFADLSSMSNVGTINQSYGAAVTSVCSSPINDHTTYASAGQTVVAVDLRKGYSNTAITDHWTLNSDEINNIAVNRQGNWLAAGDDSGEVQLIQLPQHQQQLSAVEAPLRNEKPGDASGRPTYRTLRRGHSNICAAVAFRPHRPWELISGGLDSTVVRWDFSRLRPVHTWSLSAEAAASGGQIFNPPMVHSVVVPDTEDRPYCRLMAVGRGDGAISVYDIDSKPVLPPEVGNSSNSGSSSKRGKGKAKGKQKAGGSGSRGSAAGMAQRQEEAQLADDAVVGRGAGGTACTEQGGRESEPYSAPDSWRVPFVPGRVCLLGRDQGGHTAAVSCLTFLEGGGSAWGRLVSGGNDGRLLVWDWRLAAERQAAAWKLPSSSWGTMQPNEANMRDCGQGQRGACERLQEGVGRQEKAGDFGECVAEGEDPALQPSLAALDLDERPEVLADVKHGRKINWVCRCEGVAGYNVIVADVTKRMTALHII